MENNHKRARESISTIDDVLDLVMPYIHDPKDRDSASLVCRRWYRLDSETREHVTMALCYAASPERLRTRFTNLRSLKLKGKPRAAMFNLIPEDWGGYVTPWVREIEASFRQLRIVHFRRMIVSDSDLDVLARARKDELEVLKLDKCCGFSTDGLLCVARDCRKIKTWFLEESGVDDKDGRWLHEIALTNRCLEVLNFYMTEISKIDSRDLEMIAQNCRSLVSVKMGDCEILELERFFRAAVQLEEFCGGSINEDRDHPERYDNVPLPARLCNIGLSYLGNNEVSMVYPFAAQLRKLDLLYALLDTEGHCLLIERCPNLEFLETRNVIGDRGLEILAANCWNLKRLRIERGADEQGMMDEQGLVSQRGLIALAQGCQKLEYIAIYVSDITNDSLERIGTYLENLRDFRIVLLDQQEVITDLPLDNGVRALLRGCKKLQRFALYLRSGGLTDLGLGYVGLYSRNVRWMLLGYVGQSDEGLLQFSRGCPSLQKLEMRGCCFSDRAIAVAVTRLPALRYLWVQGYRASATSTDLLAMARPFWNIELIPERRVEELDASGNVRVTEHPAHILAYYSLAGLRIDYPDSVVPLNLGNRGLQLEL